MNVSTRAQINRKPGNLGLQHFQVAAVATIGNILLMPMGWLEPLWVMRPLKSISERNTHRQAAEGCAPLPFLRRRSPPRCQAACAGTTHRAPGAGTPTTTAPRTPRDLPHPAAAAAKTEAALTQQASSRRSAPTATQQPRAPRRGQGGWPRRWARHWHPHPHTGPLCDHYT